MNRTKRTRRNKRGGNIPMPLITIPLTAVSILGIIYYLKKTIIDVKDNVMEDMKNMKTEILHDVSGMKTGIVDDVKTVMDNEVAVIDDKIPDFFKNKEKLKEIRELEDRINDIYDKISNRIKSEENFDLDKSKNSCKNKSDISRCLKSLLKDVRRLESKYAYRIDETNVNKTKAFAIDLDPKGDEDIEAAKMDALVHKIRTQQDPSKKTLKSRFLRKGTKKRTRRKPKNRGRRKSKK